MIDFNRLNEIYKEVVLESIKDELSKSDENEENDNTGEEENTDEE